MDDLEQRATEYLKDNGWSLENALLTDIIPGKFFLDFARQEINAAYERAANNIYVEFDKLIAGDRFKNSGGLIQLSTSKRDSYTWLINRITSSIRNLKDTP